MTDARTSTDLEHDPARVWQTICDDADGWLGAGSSIDPQPGGVVVVNDVVTGKQRLGTVTTVDWGHRLELEWWPTDEPDLVTTVTVTLTPSAGGTHLVITESVPAALTATSLSASASIAGVWRSAMIATCCVAVHA